MAEISVVMPVYIEEENTDALDFLRVAMDSMQAQTFKDYEMIMVCEPGTSQASLDILESYAKDDSRQKIIVNDEGLGISASMNVGIRASSGKYIARMDTDDISGARRLEVQKLFMDTYPEIGMSGIIHKVFNSPNWLVDYRTNPLDLDSETLFRVPLRHPSIITRSDVLFEHNLFYDEELPGVEDWELFIRTAKTTKMSNINYPDLFIYRRYAGNASTLNRDRDDEIKLTLMAEQFKDRLDISLENQDLQILNVTTIFKGVPTKQYATDMKRLEKLFDSIVMQNNIVGEYDEEALIRAMKLCWNRARYSMNIYTKNKAPQDALDVWRKSKYYDAWSD